MPSLYERYTSATKKEKGDLILQVQNICQIKYLTCRKRFIEKRFSHSEKTLIASQFNEATEELFPE